MKVEQSFPHKDPHVRRRIEDISRVVNGGIEFGNPKTGSLNIQGFWVKLLTPGANVEFTVNHNLGYIPSGIIIISVDSATVIYSSRLASWTTKQMFLKSSLAAVNLVGYVI
jgi:hypothetical protein